MVVERLGLRDLGSSCFQCVIGARGVGTSPPTLPSHCLRPMHAGKEEELAEPFLLISLQACISDYSYFDWLALYSFLEF